MNAFTRQAIAVLLIAGFAAAPASASVQRDVQQAISAGNVNITVDDAGVAALTGYTNGISRLAAERAAKNNANVESVINLIERS